MKHKPWFKVWQDRVLSDPKFRSLSLKEAGALFCLWLENARNSGGKLMGNPGFFTGILLGFQGDALGILRKLHGKGWIIFENKNSPKIFKNDICTVEIVGWDESQMPSEESIKRMERRTVQNLSSLHIKTKTKIKTKKKNTPHYPPAFETFWNSYPVKEGKGKAFDSFKKLDPQNGLLEKMLAGIEKWKKSKRWADGYVSHPTTWLNQRRWEDDPESNEPKISEAMKAFYAKED